MARTKEAIQAARNQRANTRGASVGGIAPPPPPGKGQGATGVNPNWNSNPNQTPPIINTPPVKPPARGRKLPPLQMNGINGKGSGIPELNFPLDLRMGLQNVIGDRDNRQMTEQVNEFSPIPENPASDIGAWDEEIPILGDEIQPPGIDDSMNDYLMSYLDGRDPMSVVPDRDMNQLPGGTGMQFNPRTKPMSPIVNGIMGGDMTRGGGIARNGRRPERKPRKPPAHNMEYQGGFK